MNYTVFGLGKSSYEHFNYMGRWTDRVLEDLGAKRVHQVGLGDDMGSLEDDFELWKKGLWSSIKNKIGKKDQIVNKTKKKNQLIFSVTTDKVVVNGGVNNKNLDYEFQTKQWIQAKNCKVSQIYEARQNTNDGSTLHLELDLEGTMVDYETGMNLAIFAKNTDQKVKQISEYLSLNLDETVKVT